MIRLTPTISQPIQTLERGMYQPSVVEAARYRYFSTHPGTQFVSKYHAKIYDDTTVIIVVDLGSRSKRDSFSVDLLELTLASISSR